MPDRRLVVVAGLALPVFLVALALPGVAGWRALAHAELLTSVPSPASVLETAPSELRLVFSEPLEPSFSALDLADANGAELLASAGEVDPADPHQLVVALPALPDGVYTVTWRNVSAADGHGTNGFFSFGIGEVDPEAAAGSGQEGHDVIQPWWPIPRLVAYAGILPALGMPLFAALVLRVRPARGFATLLAVLLALGAVGTVGAGIAGADAAGRAPPLEYLLGSRGGQLQLARAALLVLGALAVAALGALDRSRAAAGAAAIVALGAIVLIALGAHAAAIGPVAVVADVIHIVAVGIWLGGIIGLGLLFAQPRWLTPDPPPASVAVPRFSALAIASIGLMAATGLYADWLHTGTLVTTGDPYGLTLVLKVGLAACAFGLGALNFLDGGRRPRWLGGTRLRVATEVTLAVAVLGAAAVLSVIPPGTTARAVVLEPRPSALGDAITGMSLELLPGRPGVNRVMLVVTGVLGERPAELVMDRLDTGGQTRIPLVWQDPGAAGHDAAHGEGHGGSGEDHFVADAVVLPAASRWDATARLLTDSGTELLRQQYAFALDADGISEGRQPHAIDVALILAGLMATGGALGVGLGAGGWQLPRTDAAASRFALVGGGAIGLALGVLIGGARVLGVG